MDKIVTRIAEATGVGLKIFPSCMFPEIYSRYPFLLIEKLGGSFR